MIQLQQFKQQTKQFRDRTLTHFDQTYSMLFLILVGVLSILPFFAVFNDMLTRIVISAKGYFFIREVVVPIEIKLVAMLLTVMKFPVAANNEYIVIGSGQPFFAEIVWNCIGWQSLLFFVITVFVALQGDRYSFISKLKAIVIGGIGTFFINIIRITIIIIIAYKMSPRIGVFVHDYLGSLFLIGWLFFFWWFSFRFVLEE